MTELLAWKQNFTIIVKHAKTGEKGYVEDIYTPDFLKMEPDVPVDVYFPSHMSASGGQFTHKRILRGFLNYSNDYRIGEEIWEPELKEHLRKGAGIKFKAPAFNDVKTSKIYNNEILRILKVKGTGRTLKELTTELRHRGLSVSSPAWLIKALDKLEFKVDNGRVYKGKAVEQIGVPRKESDVSKMLETLIDYEARLKAKNEDRKSKYTELVNKPGVPRTTEKIEEWVYTEGPKAQEFVKKLERTLKNTEKELQKVGASKVARLLATIEILEEAVAFTGMKGIKKVRKKWQQNPIWWKAYGPKSKTNYKKYHPNTRLK